MTHARPGQEQDTMLDKLTFDALLHKQAAARGDAPFLVFPGHVVSYAEMLSRAQEVARGLIARGVRRGDHVAVLMPNCMDAVVIFLGAHLAGAAAVPINARFKRRELAHVIAHSDARILFTTSMVREHVDFVGLIWDSVPGLREHPKAGCLSLAHAPRLETIVISHGEPPEQALSYLDFTAGGAHVSAEQLSRASAATSPDNCAFLLYTSGTTANPKGCELTHAAVIRSWMAYAELIGFRPGDGIWTPCPFFHVGGIGPMASALVHGGQLLSTMHFDADEAARLLRMHRPAHLFPAFPQLTFGLLRSVDYVAERFEFIKTVLNVGPPEMQAQIQALLPPGALLLNDYGMTEGSGIITATRPDDPPAVRLGTNGYPMSGTELRIVDPASRTPVAVGTEGEIQFRGVNALRAYYKDPIATAASIAPDGWVSTGDCGAIDASGALKFIGRIKDILKVGGENVAPAEIEAYLGTHPSVKMAQVIGRADAKYGEVPVAFVELLPQCSVDGADLIAYCVGHIANYKVPREVRFVTEWPTSATKIQKFKLREQL
jgi:acyl-CoA synthetase (AMP-forming)/AMP-acid ligase II